MDANYMLACAIVWRKTSDPEAGLELAEALESPDLSLRALALAILIDGDENSLRLLESALTAGVISPETGCACIAEILRNRQDGWKGINAREGQWHDSFSC